MDSYPQSQWPSWSYNASTDSFPGYSQMPNYTSYLADSMEVAYQNHQQHLVHHHQMSRTTESKPRLSKEEVEVLEAEFQKNHKPNSTTKKALAESMRVENARINVSGHRVKQGKGLTVTRTGSKTGGLERRRRTTLGSTKQGKSWSARRSMSQERGSPGCPSTGT